MTQETHYETLEINRQASQVEVKQAYRRLVKQFHPDCRSETANHDKIAQVNAAYEILGDPDHRELYDQELNAKVSRRQKRTADAQSTYKRRCQTAWEEEQSVNRWYREIYLPLNRWINCIIHPLDAQIDQLAADLFNDDLMAEFQRYLEECRDYLTQAQKVFVSSPNPAKFAKVAASLYYCLNHLSDGIEELEYFTLNYDDHQLHNGQELFRMAQQLYREAQDISATLLRS